MLKSLTIPVILVLCAASADLVSAQSNQTAALTNHADDPRSSRPADRPVSPEARTEARRLYKEGVKYGLAGLYSQAAEIFQQSIKLDPQFADAHFALGHAYFDLRRWPQAVKSLERAVELNPKDADAQDRLAFARTMLENESASGRTVAAPAKAPEATEKPEPSEIKTNTDEFALTRIYRVGPNDVLDVRLADSSASQSTLFTITPSGFFEHPMLVEPLPVGGLTIEEITGRLENDLKRRALDHTKVSVGVRDYASHTILVSGLVKDSGTKILRREAIPLYVVVADAQPLPEAARATVVRNESNQTYEVDLAEPAEMNMLVRPGDVVTLHANSTQFLYVGGEVKSPGETTYRRGLTLTQAIISAGGVTGKPKEVRLGRDDGRGFLVVTRIKLKEIESGKVPDPPVRPGDRIMVLN
jgi:protein involved in polysaccharide export with SLBB domain